jgi:predicted amidophosphoribosyltransferase
VAKAPVKVTKRCSVCGRFRPYIGTDVFCISCGNDALESNCTCGRGYDYALDDHSAETASLHCPQCGKSLKGRSAEFEP